MAESSAGQDRFAEDQHTDLESPANSSGSSDGFVVIETSDIESQQEHDLPDRQDKKHISDSSKVEKESEAKPVDKTTRSPQGPGGVLNWAEDAERSGSKGSASNVMRRDSDDIAGRQDDKEKEQDITGSFEDTKTDGDEQGGQKKTENKATKSCEENKGISSRTGTTQNKNAALTKVPQNKEGPRTGSGSYKGTGAIALDSRMDKDGRSVNEMALSTPTDDKNADIPGNAEDTLSPKTKKSEESGRDSLPSAFGQNVNLSDRKVKPTESLTPENISAPESDVQNAENNKKNKLPETVTSAQSQPESENLMDSSNSDGRENRHNKTSNRENLNPEESYQEGEKLGVGPSDDEQQKMVSAGKKFDETDAQLVGRDIQRHEGEKYHIEKRLDQSGPSIRDENTEKMRPTERETGKLKEGDFDPKKLQTTEYDKSGDGNAVNRSQPESPVQAEVVSIDEGTSAITSVTAVQQNKNLSHQCKEVENAGSQVMGDRANKGSPEKQNTPIPAPRKKREKNGKAEVSQSVEQTSGPGKKMVTQTKENKSGENTGHSDTSASAQATPSQAEGTDAARTTTVKTFDEELRTDLNINTSDKGQHENTVQPEVTDGGQDSEQTSPSSPVPKPRSPRGSKKKNEGDPGSKAVKPDRSDKSPTPLPRKGAVPSAPVGPLSVDMTETTCDLSWKPPENDGGTPVTGYVLQVSDNMKSPQWNTVMQLPPDQTTCEHKGLVVNNEYVFRVLAENGEGQSQPLMSDTVIPQKKLFVPSAPENVSVTKITENGVSLQWHVPSDNGGAKISCYHILSCVEGSDDWIRIHTVDHHTAPVLDFLVDGLEYDKKYILGVTAENGVGNSDIGVTTKPVLLKKSIAEVSQSVEQTSGPGKKMVTQTKENKSGENTGHSDTSASAQATPSQAEGTDAARTTTVKTFDEELRTDLNINTSGKGQHENTVQPEVTDGGQDSEQTSPSSPVPKPRSPRDGKKKNEGDPGSKAVKPDRSDKSPTSLPRKGAAAADRKSESEEPGQPADKDETEKPMTIAVRLLGTIDEKTGKKAVKVHNVPCTEDDYTRWRYVYSNSPTILEKVQQLIKNRLKGTATVDKQTGLCTIDVGEICDVSVVSEIIVHCLTTVAKDIVVNRFAIKGVDGKKLVEYLEKEENSCDCDRDPVQFHIDEAAPDMLIAVYPQTRAVKTPEHIIQFIKQFPRTKDVVVQGHSTEEVLKKLGLCEHVSSLHAGVSLSFHSSENGQLVCALHGPGNKLEDSEKEINNFIKKVTCKNIQTGVCYCAAFNAHVDKYCMELLAGKGVKNVCFIPDITHGDISVYGLTEDEVKTAAKFVIEHFVEKKETGKGWSDKLKCAELEKHFGGKISVHVDNDFDVVYITGVKEFVKKARREIKNFLQKAKPAEGDNQEITGHKYSVSTKNKESEALSEKVCEEVPCSTEIALSFMKSDDGTAFLKALRTDKVDLKLQDIQDSSSVLLQSECEKISWCFPSGHMVTVMKCQVWDSGAEWIVRLNPGETGQFPPSKQTTEGKVIQLDVPQWNGGATKEKSEVRNNVKTVLHKLINAGYTTVGFPVQSLNDWPLNHFIKNILKGILELFEEKPSLTPTQVYLCNSDPDNYCTCLNACKSAFKGLAHHQDSSADEVAQNPKEPESQTIERGDSSASGFTISVVSGSLDQTEVDAIVNTTDTQKWNLSAGAVSYALSVTAGPGLQDECRKRYPTGLTHGQIVETSGHKLKCKYVLHGSLPAYSGKKSQTTVRTGSSHKGVGNQSMDDILNIRKFVVNSLTKATALRCTSIAFPALGTGNLNYPAAFVSIEMYNAVDRFFQDNPTSTIKDVKFVIYKFDATCIEEFEAKDRQRKQHYQQGATNMRSANTVEVGSNDTVNFGHVSVTLEEGRHDTVSSKWDCLLYLWEKHEMHTAKLKGHKFLTKLGESVTQRWNKTRQGPESSKVFSTAGGNLNHCEIIHVPCEEKKENFQTAIREGLIHADKEKMRRVLIPFSANHSFLKYGKDLCKSLIEAVREVASSLQFVGCILVVVEGKGNYKPFHEMFRTYLPVKGKPVTGEPKPTQSTVSTPLAKATSPSTVTVVKIVGETEAVKQAKACIVARLSELEKGQWDSKVGQERWAAVTGSYNQQGAKDEQDDTVEKWTLVDHGPSTDEMERCIVLTGIKEGTTKEDIKKWMSDMKLQTLYMEYPFETTKALLIFSDPKDVDAVKQNVTGRPYTAEKLKPRVLCKIRGKVDRRIIEAARQQNKMDELKTGLCDQLCLNLVLTEDDHVLEALTLQQLKSSEDFLHCFAKDELQLCVKKRRPPSFSEFEDVSKVNVSPLHYEVLMALALYENQRNKLKDEGVRLDYEETSGCVTVSGTLDRVRFAKDWIKNKMRTLQELAVEEINIPSVYEKGIGKLKSSAKEMEWAGQAAGCVFLPGRKVVCAVGTTYEEMNAIKHKFLVKIGAVKLTGRTRGHRKLESAQTPVVPPETFPQQDVPAQFQHNFSFGRDAKCVEQYRTEDGLEVYVYEANLLKVPVDCIVNAANENLQHGGGVARVIAVGAGSALTQEGDAYIRQNGRLHVGTACSTTAGRLPYRCVIHTVGPCWYDYSPHSQRDVNRCEADLYNAIMNSFLEAEKKSLRSIALPAVSAAIFGVPEKICVMQYARATVDYSRQATRRLTEIHFVDKNRNIVLQIQAVFKAMLEDKQQPFYNKQEQSRHSNWGHSSSSTGYTSEHNPPESLLSIAGSQVTSTSPTLCSVVCYDQKIAGADHLICRVGSVCMINVYRANMVELKDIDMCVCSDDNRGSGKGAVVSRLIKKGGPGYVDARRKEFKLWQTDGAVVVSYGGNTGYKRILHGVLPHDSEKQERMILLRKIFASVMTEVRKHKAGSMILPLIGIGKQTPSQTDIQEWVDLFMEFYCSFSLERKDIAFTVHLVCKEILLTDKVKEAVKRFEQNLQQQNSSPNTGDRSGYNKDELSDVEAAAGIDSTSKSHQESVSTDVKADENCVICMDEMTDPKTLKCGHSFCKDCIEQYLENYKKMCPTCGVVCGIITGDQPPGQMSISYNNKRRLTGFEHWGTIEITYSFPSGRQGPEHPNPGKFYKGIHRTAYLPDNREGKKVCKMLQVAFDRKLVFTIGNSRTTGEEGVITWNDVHHKTNPNPYGTFGYPDDTYLDRVKEELAAKGVTEEDIK